MIRVTINAAKLRAMIEAEFLISKLNRPAPETRELTGWASAKDISEETKLKIIEAVLKKLSVK